MAFNVWFIIWPNQKKALGIVECDPDQISIGDRVEAVFEEATNRDGESGPPLLRFRTTES